MKKAFFRFVAAAALAAVLPAAAATSGDFNLDNRSDILWRHRLSGQNYLYPMSGLAVLGAEGTVSTVADAEWKVVGIGDFDGNGRADVLWRHAITGLNFVYLMNGIAIASQGYILPVTDVNWRVAAVADFDGDGRADILWRHALSGQNYVYLMNGLTVASQGFIPTVADALWTVAGAGDIDGDGKADVLWRHDTSGQNYLYFMNGLVLKSQGFTLTVADANWKVAGVCDFDADSRADILWRHGVSGQNYLYPMDGTAVKSSQGFVRTVPLPWAVANVGDYDGDAKCDIFWRNATSGENYLFPMDGLTVKAGEGYTRSVAGPDWEIVGRAAWPNAAPPPEPANLIGILAAHNQVRTTVSPGNPLPPLTWSVALATTAANWAATCTDLDGFNGFIDHNPGRSTGHPYYVGENIYGSTVLPSVASVVDGWASEVVYYNYSNNTCQVNQVCGHYTQLVWRNTLELGCARSNCPAHTFRHGVVCNYGPGGNIGGQFPY